MYSRAGFTIVELIVVIAIIGLLSAIVFSSFGGARDEARNRAIQTELKEVQLALEVYKAQNGAYPNASTQGAGICSGTANGADFAITDPLDSGPNCGLSVEYIVDLAPDFVPLLPRSSDSGNSSCTLRYEVEETDQSWYKLTAENCFAGAETAAEGIQPNSEFAQCPGSCGTCDGNTFNAAYQATADFYETMAVYSAGGECQ